MSKPIKPYPPPWIEMSLSPSIGWVRVFGHGIHYKNARRHGLIFSERNGHVGGVTIFGWRFRYLPPPRIADGDLTDEQWAFIAKGIEERKGKGKEGGGDSRANCTVSGPAGATGPHHIGLDADWQERIRRWDE